jgi:glutamate racemase
VNAADGPVLVFDSGFGGLSVVRAIRDIMPDRPLAYVADDAAFPYGDMSADALRMHILAVMERVIARFRPSAVVIACNTASTVVLEPLRAVHGIPFVGTVPAIKPAAERSASGVVSVLATPATIERDYTRALIADFAGRCHVRLVGAPQLARMAEDHMLGVTLERGEVWQQIAPCFHEVEGRQSDIVVLACTHYPFLVDLMSGIAPWPVTWLDPAPAIARRLSEVTCSHGPRREGADPVVTTSGQGLSEAARRLFADYCFAPMPGTRLS